MITVAALAEYFEDELNALIASDEKFEFKSGRKQGTINRHADKVTKSITISTACLR